LTHVPKAKGLSPEIIAICGEEEYGPEQDEKRLRGSSIAK